MYYLVLSVISDAWNLVSEDRSSCPARYAHELICTVLPNATQFVHSPSLFDLFLISCPLDYSGSHVSSRLLILTDLFADWDLLGSLCQHDFTVICSSTSQSMLPNLTALAT